MPSPNSLRRLANLTKQVRNDLRRGGMAINFKYLFRSTAILARIVEVLADHVATQAEEEEARRAAEGTPADEAPSTQPAQRRTRETIDS